MSLNLSVANKELLKKAAESIGLTMRSPTTLVTEDGQVISIRGDKAVCDESLAGTVNKLRVAYAKAAVDTVAAKYGWRKTVKSNNKLTLKRSY